MKDVNSVKVMYKGQELRVDFSEAKDLTIPIRRKNNVNAYGLTEPEFNIFRTEGFTGSVKEDGSCNCESLNIVPHGNGTHTECIGHITTEPVYITDCLKEFNFIANIISIEPENDLNGNKLILPSHIEKHFSEIAKPTEALIIRTLPNDSGKLSRKYSGTNAAYFSIEAIQFLNKVGIKHLLVDLPSVDHESDPNLKAHHEFWQYPGRAFMDKTITELVYIPDNIKDGMYWLNLIVPAIETDAVPSRVIVYPLKKSS